MHALFLILNIGPTERLPIDPDPQVAGSGIDVRAVERWSYLKAAELKILAMRSQQRNLTAQTGDVLSNGSADIVLTDFFSETGSRRTN